MERSDLPQSPTIQPLAQSVADMHYFHELLDGIKLEGHTGCGMSSSAIMMTQQLIEARAVHSPHGELTVIDDPAEEYRHYAREHGRKE